MATSMDKSLSDSELNPMNSETTPPSFINCRRKKRKLEGNDELKEMKDMIVRLTEIQEKEFKKNAFTLKEIQQSNRNIENTVSFLSAQNEELKLKIEKLQAEKIEDRKLITTLENKIEDIQRENRKANLELKNVPKKHNETKEDLVEMVVNLSKNIGGEISKSNIKDIYRVRGKKDEIKNTPIIIETSSTIVKNDILKLCKSFNIKHKTKLCAKHLGHRVSEDTPIYISEHLTAKASRLYFLARDLVKAKTFKFCWTAYGRVYLRKDEQSPIILVFSESQIQNLIRKT
ncbi:myosin-15-like [Amyelois transitella]|uniref:myosin-15-like n=1 Tax=Amyelois transitella TaxID=680683 RepID=UPI00298FA07A|nr:myosin-15-like [Amyelois transitella]